MNIKPPTYYVIEPRNELCRVVNPQLWREFVKQFGNVSDQNFFTEEFCVQWLDNYYENVGMYKETVKE